MSDFDLLPGKASILPSDLILNIGFFTVYLALLWLTTKLPMGALRRVLFLIINLACAALICAAQGDNVTYLNAYLQGLRDLGPYVVLISAIYLATRFLAFGQSWWIAAFLPIALLAIIRYAPASAVLRQEHWIGFSYMAFRLSQLVVIVRNKLTPMPGLLEYLGFAFFAPTLMAGPISSYSTFAASESASDKSITPPLTCFMRVIIGACKVLFFSSVLSRLTYKGLLLDYHPHPPIDLVVAAVAYYLYLYFNFSGYCDIAIGASGLVGIKVSENFNKPFAARNIQDFWNRWHITLSSFMRDMFFSPVSKALVSRLPAPMAPHAIALTIFMVFVLIGAWHGRGLNFLIYGAIHATAVVTNYYYGLALKKYLTKEQFRAYQQNKYIKAVCIVVTFMFVAASLFFLANSFFEMFEIIYFINAFKK